MQFPIINVSVAHVGINTQDETAANAVSDLFGAAFDFDIKQGNSSVFASSGVEVLKSMYLGDMGHIAIRTNSIPRAAAALAKAGFALDESTTKLKGEQSVAVYLKQQFGGFAIHLLQK